MNRRPSVLAAVADPELMARLDGLLQLTEARTRRVSDGMTALALAAREPFDLVILRAPLSGLGPCYLLSALRGGSSASATAEVVMQATEEARRELAEAPELAAGIAVCADETALLKAAAARLGLTDRSDVRLLVQVEMIVASERVRQLWQTENVSLSGMLLKTRKRLPVGAVLPFSIELPEDETPIHGRAEVIRYADQDAERVAGMGVRFLGFDLNGARRLGEYLQANDASGTTRAIPRL